MQIISKLEDFISKVSVTKDEKLEQELEKKQDLVAILTSKLAAAESKISDYSIKFEKCMANEESFKE